MDELDREIRGAVYRLFVDLGRAPVPAEVAKTLDVTPLEVEDGLRRLHDSHVFVLAPGTPYIWMAHPFSALPTPYSATVDGRSFWGNCIWDALGIVAILGGDGRVDTLCPDCGDELRLEVRDDELVPSDHVVHYAVSAAHWWDDIGFN